jgi:hypothetical protein
MENQTINFVDSRVIRLPNGNELRIDLTNVITNKIRETFNLGSERLTDDHVRMFLWGAINNAISKEEANLSV